jgi:hypothetical protein
MDSYQQSVLVVLMVAPEEYKVPRRTTLKAALASLDAEGSLVSAVESFLLPPQM